MSYMILYMGIDPYPFNFIVPTKSPELARPLRHGLAQVVGATLELGGHLRISGAEPWVVK